MRLAGDVVHGDVRAGPADRLAGGGDEHLTPGPAVLGPAGPAAVGRRDLPAL